MSNRQPPLVLITAEDQAVREALQFALRLEGLSVRTHREAGALLTDPDLSTATCVILDDQRPYLDGFELLNELRAREMRMPVILLTNHATGRLRARAAGAGLRTVLEKPLLDNVLVDSIQTILSSTSATGSSC
jgi:two-component system response regulator FixJ